MYAIYVCAVFRFPVNFALLRNKVENTENQFSHATPYETDFEQCIFLKCHINYTIDSNRYKHIKMYFFLAERNRIIAISHKRHMNEGEKVEEEKTTRRKKKKRKKMVH